MNIRIFVVVLSVVSLHNSAFGMDGQERERLVITMEDQEVGEDPGREKRLKLQQKLQLDILKNECDVLVRSGLTAIYRNDDAMKKALSTELYRVRREAQSFGLEHLQYRQYESNAIQSDLYLIEIMLREGNAGCAPWLTAKLRLWGSAVSRWTSGDQGIQQCSSLKKRFYLQAGKKRA